MTAPLVSPYARPRLLGAVCALALAGLAACGPERGFGTDAGTTDASMDGRETGDASTDGATTDGPTADGPISTDVPPIPVDGGTVGTDMTIVYAHAGTKLYSFDPRNRTPTVTYVGEFLNIAGTTMTERNPSFTDIAVDRDGNVVGVTREVLYRIDPTTAECTRIAMLNAGSSLFVALSYIPEGGREILVGGTQDGVLFEINPSTGAATRRAQIRGTGGDWQISGDFVSVVGAGTYVTVRRSTNANDWLALVDLDSGMVTPVSTRDTGFKNIFGLGYWRATVFGFTRDGEFLSINAMTGRATEINLPTSLMNLSFAGAGSTTIAPTGPG